MNARLRRALSFGSVSFLSVIAGSTANAAQQGGPCSATAQAALTACRNDTEDNYWITIGNCRNISDGDARSECLQDAADSRGEELAQCREESEARFDLCGELGEARYDPVIDPSKFVDPRQIGRSVAPNPYLMLVPGRTMIYRNGDERIVVTVTRQVTEILGVKCAVIHDVSRVNGVLNEDTIDWLAQDIYGNVWYFGELSQSFEDGQLSSLEGSWKAGVDYAKPGIVMEAAPAVGDVYRQEFALGDAEDAARVASLTASAQTGPASCKNTCLATQEFSPKDPGVIERKYYAPNVGLLLTVEPESGERETLVEIRP